MALSPPHSATDGYPVSLAVIFTSGYSENLSELATVSDAHEHVHWVQLLHLDDFREATDAEVIHVAVVVIGRDPLRLSSARCLVNEFDTADNEVHVRAAVVSLPGAHVDTLPRLCYRLPL